MNFIDSYPLVITDKRDLCVEFWISFLEMKVAFEDNWLTLLQNEDHLISIAFMNPDHPSVPQGSESFQGQGMCFIINARNVTKIYTDLLSKGLKVENPLTNDNSRQIKFSLRDPSGLWIDVNEQIEPISNYWDKSVKTVKSSKIGKYLD